MSRAIENPEQLKRILDIPFSDEQMAAIIAPQDEPQAIIAGAGSGKTTVMAARVVWLVGHEGVDPARILGLTFTNKAASELASRIRYTLNTIPGDRHSEVAEPTVSTYHAFAGNLIAEHGLRLGIEPDLRIMADASRYQLAGRAIASYDRQLQHVSTSLPSCIREVLALDGELSEHLVSTEALRAYDTELVTRLAGTPVVRGGLTAGLQEKTIQTSERRIEVSLLVDAYRLAKLDAGVMDFSDQMAWGARLSELPEVGQDLRSRFDVVLLDEYQDTSVAQRDLLQNLFSGVDPEHGRGHGVTSVGDPAQGIYGWRGAAADNLEGFLDDFPKADGSRGNLISLDTSRRCGAHIIDVANTVAAEYYATSTVVSPLRAAPGNGEGAVGAGLYADVETEIDAVVDMIQQIHEEGIPWREIAILVRHGGENTAIVNALRSASVPVEVLGLNGLLSQPEVRDVLSVLELLDDVTANPAAIRLLTGPRWRIGHRDLALLGQRAAILGQGLKKRPSESLDPETILDEALYQATAGVDPTEIVSIIDAVDDPGDLAYSTEARERFEDFSRLLASLRQHTSEPLFDLARRVMTALDLDLELLTQPDSSGMDNLAALFDAISVYSTQDNFASLSGLLAYLGAEEEYNQGMEVSSPSDADSVKLLTAHKAKGLEYEAVFVPFVSDSVFPSGKGRPRWISTARALPVELRGDRDSLPDIEDWDGASEGLYKKASAAEAHMEEVRLAYVAFTRAKQRLFVSGHRWGRTQVKPRKESAFLISVRDWLNEKGMKPVEWAPEPEPDEVNPFMDRLMAVTWPAPLHGLEQRIEAARLVQAHREGGELETTPVSDGTEAEAAELERLAVIAEEIALLREEVTEAESSKREIVLPDSLPATAVLELAKGEAQVQAFLRQTARPMPRKPSGSARFGTKFHAWIETHFGSQSLLDPTDLPGQGDAEIASDVELQELIAAFESGPYANRQPYATEAPFSIMLGGQQIVGRIDAVFATDEGFEVVDWKTNRSVSADPLQLAIYRLAWAELHGLELTQVKASFYYVRLDKVATFDDLPDRAALELRLGLA